MDKQTVIQKIKDAGIVAVVRAENGESAKKISDACLEGGVPAIELTFTVPGAHRVIEELAAEYKNGEMILGAGTVLDAETARIAILSGAQYIVSPCYDEATVRLCNRYAIPCMPGVMTIKDVVAALEMGVDIIKLFPGDSFGPGMVKAIKGPIPQANIMPTGGVDVNNVAQWIKAGVAAVGAGSSLTKGAKTGDYKAITETGRQFVENIKNARASLAR
ncbi:bifunctional 2-keto-4-hydroxyglutarate aldolase/2-keto-3-deoxy-6-phosphogluconate aldolase [Qingrenia yutianensis]|uniref:Bifunctional 2-keto-4-hydroxyglutarate aldolase/2-keto-3-deoxy-6-phosphogluconate aldolase n=1 Tax=Qingrenia yutianensis TaxID=2763676 RepID=A0A926F7F5_9FIRM|nr:bifunctional 2-keto-4-hydroxyglutarate aldolase/2-keto-3-deoxy-6-phosphogluconate aldolase [Qingrenia yutianensis]MBC8596111.1 bifunctional 2-keto-4-hydroxyglutarate aldolase/2-keto-3-deoxy-6-phosphogluconate aldolase [Qingrenia yutianensis]